MGIRKGDARIPKHWKQICFQPAAVAFEQTIIVVSFRNTSPPYHYDLGFFVCFFPSITQFLRDTLCAVLYLYAELDIAFKTTDVSGEAFQS